MATLANEFLRQEYQLYMPGQLLRLASVPRLETVQQSGEVCQVR